MKIIGLTGGIGMGKSTAAAAFHRAAIPVFDAAAAVHALQSPGGRAITPIAAAFPGTVHDRTLNRAALRDAVLGQPDRLRALERIIHPLVRQMERAAIAHARRSRAPAIVLDIPLLLETGGDRRVDLVVVVSAPRAVQIARVRHRGRMNEAQISAVIARQMPDRQKRHRADFVVNTGLSRHHALRTVARIIRNLRA